MRLVLGLCRCVGWSLLAVVWGLVLASIGLQLYARWWYPDVAYHTGTQLAFAFGLVGLAAHFAAGLWPFRRLTQRWMER